MAANDIIFDILRKKYQKKNFTTLDVYRDCLQALEKQYPYNNNLKPKIRQCLQILVSKEKLIRLSEGVYMLNSGG